MEPFEKAVLEDVVKVLMDADKDAVRIIPEYEPTTPDDKGVYAHISDYRVIVNYNILAKALYNAGYRKDGMTDGDILDFCKQHNVEVCFSFQKETNGCHLRIRRGAWQCNMIIAPEQIKRTKAWGPIIKEVLCNMVNKLDRDENALKAEMEASNDPN